MGRWTQFEEDSYRLPEGMTRIAYDADTKVYTFRDRDGKLYTGEPEADYGILTPVSGTGGVGDLSESRPGAFDSGEPRKEVPLSPSLSPSTFHDILPPSLITTSSSSADRPAQHSPTFPVGERLSPRVQFVDVVRRAALPKMQGVVHNLRRSVTSARKTPPSSRAPGEDAEGLLRRGSSVLSRNTSLATSTRSGVSVDTPMLVDSDSHR